MQNLLQIVHENSINKIVEKKNELDNIGKAINFFDDLKNSASLSFDIRTDNSFCVHIQGLGPEINKKLFDSCKQMLIEEYNKKVNEINSIYLSQK